MDVNQNALTYWSTTGYSLQGFHDACAELDQKYMIAVVSFNGTGDVEMRLSRRTWDRQEGHYPSVAKYFTVIAHHPAMHGVKGDVAVWLEDGLWEWDQVVSRRVPLFAFGRHMYDHYTLLMPDPAYIKSQGYEVEIQEQDPVARDNPWNERLQTIFWRGAASGLGMDNDSWRVSPRILLTSKAREINNPCLVDAKITRLSHLTPERQEDITALGLTSDEVPFQEFYRYRYLVDVDGYCCAWRSLFLKLATGSVVLKVQSPYLQWFYPELKPWKHYIPLSPDLSDLEDVYGWLVAHDNEVQEIAQQGNEFIRSLEYYASIGVMAEMCRKLIEAQRQA